MEVSVRSTDREGKKEEEGENVSDSTVRNERWLVWAVWAEPEVT